MEPDLRWWPGQRRPSGNTSTGPAGQCLGSQPPKEPPARAFAGGHPSLYDREGLLPLHSAVLQSVPPSPPPLNTAPTLGPTLLWPSQWLDPIYGRICGGWLPGSLCVGTNSIKGTAKASAEMAEQQGKEGCLQLVSIRARQPQASAGPRPPLSFSATARLRRSLVAGTARASPLEWESQGALAWPGLARRLGAVCPGTEGGTPSLEWCVMAPSTTPPP